MYETQERGFGLKSDKTTKLFPQQWCKATP